MPFDYLNPPDWYLEPAKRPAAARNRAQTRTPAAPVAASVSSRRMLGGNW